MQRDERIRILDELINDADRIKELEFRKIEIQQEQRTLAGTYQEIEYKNLIDIESATDARSRELYSDEFRKDREVEHRLRVDPRAREIRARHAQLQNDVERIDAEIKSLEEKKLPLEAKAGISISQFVKNRLRRLRMEKEFDV